MVLDWKRFFIFEIRGHHGSKYEDLCIVDYDAV